MSRYGFGADQFFDGNRPLSGGKLYFYETGTSTPKTTYSNSSLTTPNTWPVVLDGDGRQGDVFFSGAAKMVIKSAANVQIDEVDPVYPVQTTVNVVVGADAGVSVETWADLLLIDSDTDFSTCTLLGFTAPGDGGGGTFYWDNTSTETVDIGIVVKPTATVGAGRWIRIFSGAINPKWFGAAGDGATDDLTALTNATASAVSRGLALHLVSGTYLVSDYIPMLDGMQIFGDGSRRSVIQKETGSANDRIFNKVDPLTQYDSFSLINVGLVGDRVAQPAEVTGGLIAGRTIDNIHIESCRFSEGRGFGLNFNVCKNVRVVNSDFENLYRDACGVWSATRVIIEGNNFLRNDDDCISIGGANLNTDDANQEFTTAITGNVLTDTGGIRCTYGRNLLISNNVIKRTKASEAAIFVTFDSGAAVQLANPQSVLISSNVIADCIDRDARSSGGGSQNNRIAIKLEGMPAEIGALAAPPKELNVLTGRLVAPYTYNYSNTGSGGTDPVPRMFNIKVSDNLVVRTLPSGVDYSDWGYGEMFTRLSGTGWVDPAITEAYMSCTPMLTLGPVRTLLIANNHFNATGAFGVWFNSFESGAAADFSLCDIHVINNLIKNVTITAIEFSSNYDGTYVDVRIDQNIIDCDPDLVHVGRIETAGVLTGGWTALDSLVACNYKETIGCQFFRNVFKNCSSPFISGGTGIAQFEDNIIEGQPAVGLFDVTNLGVGYIPEDQRVTKVVYRDSDPSSSTYGALLEYAVTMVGTASPPTEGFYIRGTWMPIRSLVPVTKNGVSQAILGYQRLVTGKAQVVNTDWLPVYVEL